jgi:hypothetical protein
MFSFFTDHEYMPCEDCGASVARAERQTHVCDEKRRLEYELFRLSCSEIAIFEDELALYLATLEGRFHIWYAERDRRRAA